MFFEREVYHMVFKCVGTLCVCWVTDVYTYIVHAFEIV